MVVPDAEMSGTIEVSRGAENDGAGMYVPESTLARMGFGISFANLRPIK